MQWIDLAALLCVMAGCKISGGVSNIAFSFRGNEPVRRAFHSAFLHHACKARSHYIMCTTPPVPAAVAVGSHTLAVRLMAAERRRLQHGALLSATRRAWTWAS